MESRYGSGYESRRRRSTSTPPVRRSYESHGESRGSGVLTYEEWKRTNPPIVVGGLSSEGEMRRGYEEWLIEQRGGRVDRSVRSNESRIDSKSTSYYTPELTQEEKNKKYFAEIDKLIEDLEKGMKETNVTSASVKAVMDERQQKIQVLRDLVADARKAEEERILVEKKKEENNKLDEAILRLKKDLKIQ